LGLTTGEKITLGLNLAEIIDRALAKPPKFQPKMMGGLGAIITGKLAVTTTDQTANREQNVIYQNLTGKLIFLAISVYIEPYVGEICYLRVGSTSPPIPFVAQLQCEGGQGLAISAMICFFIKPDEYYMLWSGNGEIPPQWPVTITMWFEQTLELVAP
jgi:hypothetical protein